MFNVNIQSQVRKRYLKTPSQVRCQTFAITFQLSDFYQYFSFRRNTWSAMPMVYVFLQKRFTTPLH